MSVLSLQSAAIELAGAEARQRLGGEDHSLGDLEFGELAFEEILQVLLGRGLAPSAR